MKNIILSTLLMGSVYANASEPIGVSIDARIQQTLQLKWNKVAKFRHSLDCYPGGKGNTNDDLGGETLQVNKSITATQKGGWAVKSASDFNIGSMSFSVEKLETPNEYKIAFIDNVRWDAYENRGDSGCVSREYHWHVDSHQVQGEYQVNIAVPNDTYFLHLKIKDIVGAGARFSQRLEGDLHNAIIDTKGEMYVWVKPGTKLVVPLEINVPSAGGPLASFNLTVERPAVESTGDLFKQLGKLRTSVALGSFKNDNSNAISLFAIGGALLGRADVAKTAVGSVGLTSYKDMIDWLFQIANAQFPQDVRELHVKAMAAAMAYEMAQALLEDMQVFCAAKEVYLPLSDRTVKTPGFTVAFYWLNRDVRRLEGLKFPEIGAFLEELVRWENNSLQYSEVASDAVQFKKMSDAFLKIRQHSNIAWDVYGDLQSNLKKTLETFGHIGANEQVYADLMTGLAELAVERKNLNSEFQALVMNFNKQNSKKISASPVLRRLRELEERNKQLASQLLEKVKFVSLATGDGENNVLNTMTSLLAHQIAVFDKPLTTPFIEPVRLLFKNANRTSELRGNYAQCLGE